MNLIEVLTEVNHPTEIDVMEAEANLTADEQRQLIIALLAHRNDLKKLKDTLFTTFIKIGLMDEQGVMKEKIDWKKMFGLIKSFMWDSEKAAKEFEYLKELQPLAEKYKNL